MSGIGPITQGPIAHIDPLAPAATLATSVATTNALLAALKAGGLMIQGSRYRDAVLALGATWYARLGEASGATAVAEVGANGSYVGTVTYGVTGALVGDSNTAITTNNTWGNYVDVTSSAALNMGSGDFSVVGWMSILDTSWNILACKANSTGDIGWILGYDGSSGLFKCNDGTHVPYGYRSFTPAAGWHMYAGVRSGTTTRFNFDGVDYTPGSDAGLTTVDNAIDLRIATCGEGSTAVNGSVDEPAIFKGIALTAPQLLALYNIGIGH